ncbi:MAG: CxxC-x17-CxxC domain-containing protein [Candidatus Woesearchaeota archaeon]
MGFSRQKKFNGPKRSREDRGRPNSRGTSSAKKYADRAPRRRESNRGSKLGSRDREQKPMVKVKCDECGKSCEVPFKPTEGKPVYCSECFESKPNNRSRDSRNQRSSNNSSSDLKEINDKLNEILCLLKKE